MEPNNTTLIRSVLTNEVKFVVGIVVFVVGIVAPYYSMRQDVALIQQSISNINTNHEAHIQDILQELKDMKEIGKSQQQQIIDLQKQLVILISR